VQTLTAWAISDTFRVRDQAASFPAKPPPVAHKKFGRMVTSWFRVLPDFLIIGGQRCGTTSLYYYLLQHQCIAPAQTKEVHFFDNNFDRGPLWYRTRFATLWSRWMTEVRGRRFATGEATAYYLFHPHAPRRVFQTLPQVKLIALLRNPVDRAYSHYRRSVRRGREPLPFEQAVEKEVERLRDESEKLLSDERHRSDIHRYYSYLSRGVYADQLKAWLKVFPREQLLVLRSEDFFADTTGALEKIFLFLDLPSATIPDRRPYKKASYPKMDPATRRRLLEYFAPHNERLRQFLGEDFGWDQ
jgi:hypothetical protein